MTDQDFFTLVPSTDKQIRHIKYSPKNCIGGDTDSVYLDLNFLKGQPVDKIVAFADEVGEQVNEAFSDFMQNAFFVSKERAAIIASDREVVSDASLFLARKKYVMHVIDSEGVKIDKMKIMGMEIKKTDTPKVVQDFLMSLIKTILNQSDYNTINKQIEDFKEHYHTLGPMDVGRPSNIKNFDHYQEAFDSTGDMKGFPYHVAATIFYNNLCKEGDIKIRAGDKIKVVYILHPDSKYIAIPSDADRLPDFIKDIIIDWKEQWKTVQSKIEIYLTPIGFDLQSRQKKLTSTLVQF